MIVKGEHGFSGRPELVWELLLDPEVIAKAMPGTRELTLTAPNRYEGRMVVTIGPVTAAEFALVILLEELAPPRRFVMQVDGNGRFGFTRGTARVELAPDDGGTRMLYEADLHVGGKIAAVGQRLLDVVSRTLLRAGLAALGKELEHRLGDGNRP